MGKRVLLADDSATIQKLVEMALSDSDYELQAVSDGRRAVELLPAFEPDILLVDAIMPVMDGYQVCEFVKNHEKYKKLPVILLTGRFQPFDESRAESVNVDQRIIKPFSQDQLVSTISQLLNKATDGAKGVNTHPGQDVGESFNLDDNATVHLNENDLRQHIASLQTAGGDQDESDELDETVNTFHDSADDLDDTGPFGHESIEDMDEGDVTMELSSDDLLASGEMADLSMTGEMPEGAFDTLPGNVDKNTLLGEDAALTEVEEDDAFEELDMEEVSFEEDTAPIPPINQASLDDEEPELLDMEEVSFEDVEDEDLASAAGDTGIEFQDSDDDLDKTVAITDLGDTAFSDTDTRPHTISDSLVSPEEAPSVIDDDLEIMDLDAGDLEMVSDGESFGDPLDPLDDDEAPELSEEDFRLELEEEIFPGMDASAVQPDVDVEPLVQAELEAPDLEDPAQDNVVPEAEHDEDAELLETEEGVLLETPADEPVLLDDGDLLGDVVAQVGGVEPDTQPVSEPVDEADTAPVQNEDDAITAPVDKEDVTGEVAAQPVAAREADVEAPDSEPGPPQGAMDLATTAVAGLNGAGVQLSSEQLQGLAEKIADLIVEKLGSDTVKDVIWQVVPELAEAMIKKRIYQLEKAIDSE